MTGASCVACCVSIRETIVSGVARLPVELPTEPATVSGTTILIEHPSGTIAVRLNAKEGGADLEIQCASIALTARKIMDGQTFIHEWPWTI